MNIGGRPIARVAAALTERRHYHALWRMLRVYPRAPEMLGRYLFARGSYPATIQVRTPLGLVHPTVYSRHDVLTVNEIFCREDYAADAGTRVVVDIGSNIGISALYFLTRHRQTRTFLYEPVPANVERLRQNLAGYEDRFVLNVTAVAPESGETTFGVEETGRYGGIGVDTGRTITVSCLGINELLARVLEQAPHVDVLKLDIEGLEMRTVEAIRPELLSRIRCIYAEAPGATNPLAASGFTARSYGPILQLFNRN